MIAQASALPVGATVAFPTGTAAPGFLELDGGVKSIALYPDLAAYLGDTFNKGDEGAGNFRLPESRGEFLRGWDHGRGVDAGRGIGSCQADEFKSHNHPPTGNVGQTAFMTNTYPSTVGLGGSGAGYTATQYSMATTGDRGGIETRPRNLAVMWCIKAWNAPINQGNIDIQALAALATQATEIKLGTAKIATQALTNAGADDATIVTPKKMRWGFSMLQALNGYIVFPSWLGGFVIQWGRASGTGGADITVTYPIAFPNALFVAVATLNYTVGAAVNGYVDVSTTSNTASFQAKHTFGGVTSFNWLAVGI
jgi:microcystin-dependent protein